VRQLRIGDVVIDDDSDVFVIAEIGHNHQGSVDTAKEMISAAAAAGVSAVKLQKRDNRTLFTKDFFDQPYNSENSYGATYGEHREALELGMDDYRELKAHSEHLGVLFFATAFDEPSVEFLVELGVPAIKIASGDLTNTPLLRTAAATGLPLVVSTGGASMDDVERAHEVLETAGADFCLLQCTAGYPPSWGEMNLRVIDTFRARFPDTVIGLSSHDSGIAMALAGYILGARVVEKHFTLNRAMRGTDHAFSLEPTGMRKLVRDLQRAREALGDGKKVTYPSEEAPIRKMAKALVAARPLSAGTKLTADDIARRSPADGLPAHRFDALVGHVLRRDLAADEPFDDGDLAGP
jgi:N-acetylneuraminate synthase/sialic acid synthase